MDRPTCKTCPFWDTWADGTPPTAEELEDIDFGECRRNAPSTYQLKHGSDFFDRKHNTSPEWPETHCLEWCGEHPDFPEYIKSLGHKSVSTVQIDE